MAQTVVVSNNGVGANVAVLDISTIPAGVGVAEWGTITGVLSAQSDLQAALDAKASATIGLDELASPTDVTTLNATTALHGLLRKLDGLTTTFLRGDGTWAAPTAAAADTNPNLYVTAADYSLLANRSLYFASEYAIGDGFVTDLAATAILEIG